jgi:tetratricopeptide (TPR) repeat protein
MTPGAFGRPTAVIQEAKSVELHSPRLSDEFEERMRPSRYLGYDRDHLGVALLRREMFEAAESQFRRAAYLNPYEAAFKQHLAWCLYRMGELEEALVAIDEALKLKHDDPDAPVVRERIIADIGKGHAPRSND